MTNAEPRAFSLPGCCAALAAYALAALWLKVRAQGWPLREEELPVEREKEKWREKKRGNVLFFLSLSLSLSPSSLSFPHDYAPGKQTQATPAAHSAAYFPGGGSCLLGPSLRFLLASLFAP